MLPDERPRTSFLALAVWVVLIVSLSMVLYVCAASREGVRWLRPSLNPFLLLLAGAALVALSLSDGCAAAQWLETQTALRFFSSPRWECPIAAVPPSAIFASALTWSFYSILVTSQHWRYALWRDYILPVNVPYIVFTLWLWAKPESVIA